MKRFAVVWLLLLVGVLVVASVPAAEAGSQPPGKLVFNMNIIGRPNDYSGNGALNGDRHTLFIPLKTDWYVDPCSTTGGQNNSGATAVPVQAPEHGVKLNIVAGDDFAVTDGDATDKVGELQMVPPTTGQYQIWAVAKGKPGGCLDLESYVYEGTTLVFLGSADLDRSTGKPKAINISNLVYANGIDYFAEPYEGLFWQLYNNGLRVLNIRIYEVAAQ